MEQQLQNESRKFWNGVTQALHSKQYSLATQLKVEIEERQRAKAAERKQRGAEWQPRFFAGAVTPVGKPDLTDDGQAVLKGLHRDEFLLEPNKELGA
jgi:oxysterol-binding protein-related protein 9/10/11